jgi:hypothetical protein
MDKVNGIMNDLADMANFKNFGKEVETEEEILNADGSSNWQANILLDNVKRLEQENAELKAENERLKALCDTYKTCYQAKHGDVKCLLSKYRTTLQEIKAIAEGIRNATYQFGQEADQKFFNETLGKILQKITKAEEE